MLLLHFMAQLAAASELNRYHRDISIHFNEEVVIDQYKDQGFITAYNYKEFHKNVSQSVCYVRPQRLVYDLLQKVRLVDPSPAKFEQNFVNGTYYGTFTQVLTVVQIPSGLMAFTNDYKLHYIARQQENFEHVESVQLAQVPELQSSAVMLYTEQNNLLIFTNCYYHQVQLNLKHLKGSLISILEMKFNYEDTKQVVFAQQTIYTLMKDGSLQMRDLQLNLRETILKGINQIQVFPNDNVSHLMVVLESQTLIYSLLIYPLQKQKIFPNANFPKLASRSPISLFKFENNYLIVGRKTESSGTSIQSLNIEKDDWVELNNQYAPFEVLDIFFQQAAAVLLGDEIATLFRFTLRSQVVNSMNFMLRDNLIAPGIISATTLLVPLETRVLMLLVAYNRKGIMVFKQTNFDMQLGCHVSHQTNIDKIALSIKLEHSLTGQSVQSSEFNYSITVVYPVITHTELALLEVVGFLIFTIVVIMAVCIVREYFKLQKKRKFFEDQQRKYELIVHTRQHSTSNTINESQIKLQEQLENSTIQL